MSRKHTRLCALTLSGAFFSSPALAQSGLDLGNSEGFGSGSYSAQASVGTSSAFDSDSFNGFFNTSGGGLFDSGAQFADGGTSGGINGLVDVNAEAFVSLSGRADDGTGNIRLVDGSVLSISLQVFGSADGYGDFLSSSGEAALSGTIRLIVAEDLLVQTSGSTSSGLPGSAASVSLSSLPDVSDGVLEAGTYDIFFSSFVSVDSKGVSSASASLSWQLVVIPTPASAAGLIPLSLIIARRRR